MENRLLSNIEYPDCAATDFKIFLINSWVLSNKSFNFRRFFRLALGSRGGVTHGLTPNAPPPPYTRLEFQSYITPNMKMSVTAFTHEMSTVFRQKTEAMFVINMLALAYKHSKHITNKKLMHSIVNLIVLHI